MKSNKGITLVTLIVIVAVLIIIASVSIYTGISALNSTRLKGFYTQLEIVQKRVDEIAANDEYYIDGENNKVYLSEQGSDLTEEQLNKLKDIITSEGGNSTESYVNYFRYFTKEQVKTILGIEDIDYNLFINFDERIIIAEDGIQIGKKTYYMLQSATYFVKHKSQTTTDDVDFTVNATKLTDGYYKISILPTEPETTSTIKYKSIFTKYWERTNELEIKVTGDLPQYFDITYRSLSKKKSTTKCYGIYLDAEKEVRVTLVNKLYVESDLLSIETSNSTDETIPNEITSYVLMNDIEFTPSSYKGDSQYYDKVYSDAYGYYWKPIGEVTIEKSGKFDGNNKEIHVKYTDSEEEEYTVTYNKENNYSEPEYEFNIITYLKDGESRTKTEELGIEITIKNVTLNEDLTGTTVKVKRGAPNAIKVQAIPENQTTYKSSDEATIKAENPSKINKDVELEIGYRYVTFTINTIPKDVTVTINNSNIQPKEEGKYSIEVIAGMNDISWSVSAENYIEDSGTKSASEIIKDITIDVTLKKWVTLTIITPENSTLKTSVAGRVNGDIVQDSNKYIIKVEQNSTITYTLSKEHYETGKGTIQMDEGDKTEILELEPIKVTLTINATPTEAKIKITDDASGNTIGEGTGTVSASVLEGTTVTYSVSADGYALKSITEILNQSKTLNIKLIECVSNLKSSYVGCYADIDNDGEIDGIIYADLYETTSGYWPSSQSWVYEAKSGFSSYDIRELTEEEEKNLKLRYNDENRVLYGKDNSGANDRFYVMSLTDVSTSGTVSWYYNAYSKGISNYDEITSTSFGTGRANTLTIQQAWKNGTYGTGKSSDLWNYIEEEVEKGWFLPSRDEWRVFGSFASECRCWWLQLWKFWIECTLLGVKYNFFQKC